MNPGWFSEITDKYSMGINNFFILTGNIDDHITPGRKLKKFLTDELNSFGLDVIFCSPLSSINGESYSYGNGHLTSIGNKLSSDKNIAIVIEHPETLMPNTDPSWNYPLQLDVLSLYEQLKSHAFVKSTNILILITDDPDGINKKITSPSLKNHKVTIPYPNEKNRLEFIEYLDQTSDKEIKKEISNIEFAKLTTGLTLSGMEDIYLMSEAYGILKKSFVKERKNELMKAEYGDVIEVFDIDDYDFSHYAGQEHLKKYHKEVVIGPMISGDIEIVPKGLLYTGPPGTGKTHFAKCLAGEAGINFVEFKISKILDKWVGNSEKNFAKALNCFESISPVGVFIDEIDQTFSRAEDNSGVRQAIFGMFLSALSNPENRGRIIWIAATNYPNKLDEAMKRTGRFDKKMPFLPPEKIDRMETFKIHINRLGVKSSVDDIQLAQLADRTDGYTQAEIEGVVIKSVEIMRRRKMVELTISEISDALSFLAKADNKKIQEMIELAIDECNDLEFLPDKYKSIRKT